jgi:hypothetical protein
MPNKPYNRNLADDNPFGMPADVELGESIDSQIDLEISGANNIPMNVNKNKNPKSQYDYGSGNYRSGNTPFR